MKQAIWDNERDAQCPTCGEETIQVLIDDEWICDVCGEIIEKKDTKMSQIPE